MGPIGEDEPLGPGELDRLGLSDYAVKRDRANDPPRFLIFFKSRDADALTAAMQEYAGKKVRRIQRPSVLQRLAQLRSQVKKPSIDREKRKEQVR